jgi:hypothetical protein
MALQTENLPPTKSQKPKTFFSFMPNFEVSTRLVEQAQMCRSAIRAESATPFFPYSVISHCFTLLAFSMVSAVVKVLELTSTRVYSTSRPEVTKGVPSIARSKSIGSTLAKNLIFLPAASALYLGWLLSAS